MKIEKQVKFTVELDWVELRDLSNALYDAIQYREVHDNIELVYTYDALQQQIRMKLGDPNG